MIIGLILLPLVFFDDKGTLLSATAEWISETIIKPLAAFGTWTCCFLIWGFLKLLTISAGITLIIRAFNPKLTLRQSWEMFFDKTEEESTVARPIE